MSGVDSLVLKCLHYLTGYTPRQLWEDPRVFDYQLMQACKTRLDDPDYTRHDPYHATLARQDLRLLDGLNWAWYRKNRDSKGKGDLTDVNNEIAIVTLRILDHDAVSQIIELTFNEGTLMLRRRQKIKEAQDRFFKSE